MYLLLSVECCTIQPPQHMFPLPSLKPLIRTLLISNSAAIISGDCGVGFSDDSSKGKSFLPCVLGVLSLEGNSHIINVNYIV